MPGLRLLSILAASCLMASPGLTLACDPYIEEHAGGTSASLRPHTSAFEHCEVSEATYQQLVSDWLRQRPADAPDITSLSLGRAVTFPWISRHLADAALQSPGWAARVSRAKPGERQRLAAPVINNPSFVQRLAVPFKETRYAVTGISFEKVLFGNASEVSSSKESGKVKVPYDAQFWLRLKPQGASAPELRH